MIRSFLIALIISLCLPVWGQIDAWTDKNFYAAGEKIRLGVNCHNCIADEIIHLELTDRNGKIRVNSLIQSKAEMTSAEISIPLDLSSDVYKLAIYTIWSPEASAREYLSMFLPVYSPFERFETSSGLENGSSLTQRNILEAFNTRSSVELRIPLDGKMRQANGKIDVCIYPEYWDNYPGINKDIFRYSGQKLSDQSLAVTNPVYFGLLSSAESNTLSAMYTTSLAQFDWLYVDDGVFSVSLKALKGGSNISFVSLSPEGKLNYFVPKLIPASATFNFNEIFPDQLVIHPFINDYLEELRIRWIISELYPKNTETVSEGSVVRLPPAFRSYKPSDYVQFTDTREFIHEVVSLLKHRVVEDKDVLNVLLDNKAFAFQEPLMFIDGQLVSSSKTFLDVQLSDIDRIEVYRRTDKLREYFSALGRNGAVAIYTRGRSDVKTTESSTMFIQGVQEDAKAKILDISESDEPAISPILYQDQLNTESSAELRLHFATGDEQGTFCVLLRAFDTNGNELIEKKLIQVQTER